VILPTGGAIIAICCRADSPLATSTGARKIVCMTNPLANILIIDDDDEIRSLLQVILTREGFDVRQAKDAPAALANTRRA
jgi:PleD family two-component response regulator